MAYVIAQPCIGAKETTCLDACPTGCIHPTKDEPDFSEEAQLYIDPYTCVDCGKCEPACPVSAIFPIDDLPEQWKEYADINAKYFNL